MKMNVSELARRAWVQVQLRSATKLTVRFLHCIEEWLSRDGRDECDDVGVAEAVLVGEAREGRAAASVHGEELGAVLQDLLCRRDDGGRSGLQVNHRVHARAAQNIRPGLCGYGVEIGRASSHHSVSVGQALLVDPSLRERVVNEWREFLLQSLQAFAHAALEIRLEEIEWDAGASVQKSGDTVNGQLRDVLVDPGNGVELLHDVADNLGERRVPRHRVRASELASHQGRRQQRG
mmetsp:Transcript_7800/g.19171  ORF Transcript_7800/g.19171 Transcript_7800/m.19171 type:complete len:235 (-) Transcript_7800:293-997(-)